MIDITAEMQRIISENLPEATANEMKVFIENAENVREDFYKALDTIKGKNVELAVLSEERIHLKNQIITINKAEEQRAGLDKRETALDIRERDIELEIARIKLQAAENRNNKIESLVEKVFGHPRVSVETYKNVPIMVDNGAGSIPYQNGSISESESVTKKEDKE